MIVYFDTSAFVPLLVEEASSSAFGELWSAADTVISTRLLYVETSSALVRARAAGRLTAGRVAEALALLETAWDGFRVLELDDALMRRAARLAAQFRLRGCDSVHCAAAELLGGDEIVAASADAKLLAAWRSLGLATFGHDFGARGAS
jgi:predicted nucleic acid-binding protein